MSKSHDARAMVKLTPQNQSAVDRVAAAKTKRHRIFVSRTTMANQAIEIGIKHIKP